VKTLILTVGLPRSGKSTWAKRQGVPVVSPDSIRLALHGQAWEPLAEGFVWAIAKVMVRALFISGHDVVILDSTGNTVARRGDFRSKSWSRMYKVIDTDKETCMVRAKDTDQEYLIPVIEKMVEEHNPVRYDELEVYDEEVCSACSGNGGRTEPAIAHTDMWIPCDRCDKGKARIQKPLPIGEDNG